MTKNFSLFEEKAGVSFSNKQLLQNAFTHRSYVNEHRGMLEHNERLEFLGDAVLELVVTDYLYNKYQNKTEGELTLYRASLVNAQTLAKIAHEIGVDDFLLLSKGEAKDTTGRARDNILANTMEAIIGALYLDGGYDNAKKFVLENVSPLIDKIVENGTWMDAKSKFQEKSQEIVSITPLYKTLKEVGPDHDKEFTVGVFLGNEEIAQGTGNSKQDAEQDAAEKALVAKNWI